MPENAGRYQSDHDQCDRGRPPPSRARNYTHAMGVHGDSDTCDPIERDVPSLKQSTDGKAAASACRHATHTGEEFENKLHPQKRAEQATACHVHSLSDLQCTNYRDNKGIADDANFTLSDSQLERTWARPLDPTASARSSEPNGAAKPYSHVVHWREEGHDNSTCLLPPDGCSGAVPAAAGAAVSPGCNDCCADGRSCGSGSSSCVLPHGRVVAGGDKSPGFRVHGRPPPFSTAASPPAMGSGLPRSIQDGGWLGRSPRHCFSPAPLLLPDGTNAPRPQPPATGCRRSRSVQLLSSYMRGKTGTHTPSGDMGLPTGRSLCPHQQRVEGERSGESFRCQSTTPYPIAGGCSTTRNTRSRPPPLRRRARDHDPRGGHLSPPAVNFSSAQASKSIFVIPSAQFETTVRLVPEASGSAALLREVGAHPEGPKSHKPSHTRAKSPPP
eukprot:GHVT01071821.1.p1 GENE.GHVT01071821.1~~GHVT01071821.1.p1  ORF type:complete len:442 (+),score=76.03 GHVT01071821.1:453-1778(+)